MIILSDGIFLIKKVAFDDFTEMIILSDGILLIEESFSTVALLMIIE